MRKLISSDEAKPALRQHKKPCSDCPLRRDAVPGWLGGTGTPEEWAQCLHSDNPMLCHVHAGAQCAGAAIYRANVCKSPRDKSVLLLPQDREKVFVSPMQFVDYHKKAP